MDASTARPGQAVTDSKGRIGIITEPTTTRGVNKNRVGVMWVGGNYEVAEYAEDLTAVTLEVRA